jgi:DNA-binding MarR family transcriptional regulator
MSSAQETPRSARSALSQLLGDAKDALVEELHERYSEAGYGDIRPVHGAVFRSLPPDGIRLADLAARAGMTAQSMGEHVGDLERLGYVVRVPDPQDRRARLIKPTSRGLSAMMFAREALRSIETAWAESVGEQRVAELRATLEDIRRLRASAG